MKNEYLCQGICIAHGILYSGTLERTRKCSSEKTRNLTAHVIMNEKSSNVDLGLGRLVLGARYRCGTLEHVE